MTEEEAKTKVCFQSRTFGGSQQLADGPGPNCIGSQCMAWRFQKETLQAPLNAFPSGSGWRQEGVAVAMGESAMKWVREGGYCGLAGKQ